MNSVGLINVLLIPGMAELNYRQKPNEDSMLQFMTILGISTFLSILAYKMQHDEVDGKNILTVSNVDTVFSNTEGLTAISYLRN
jgi:hypothetical protein